MLRLLPVLLKKYEIRRDEMSDAGKYLGIEGLRDMDFVITTRELAMLAKDENIDFAGLADQPYDDFMGIGSGAGRDLWQHWRRYGSSCTQRLHLRY